MNARMKFLIWWIGIPLFVAGISISPFLFLRCVMLPVEGVACWRIPTVGMIVFDMWSYLEFMGMAFAHSSFHLRWFGSIVHFLHELFPKVTVPEIWMLLRWIFGICSWWVASWTISEYLKTSRSFSRVSASVLWISVFLTLGFRPAVYSWFLPIGFIACIFAVRCADALDHGAWKRAIIYSVFSVVVSTIYAWFFLFICFWIGSIWAVFLHRFFQSRKSILGMWSGLSFFVVGVVAFFVAVSDDGFQSTLTTLERNGLAFTHAVVIASMLLAACMWLVLVILFARRKNDDQEDRRISRILFISWIVTILAWCSSLFTGVFLQNDHFRIFILLFSWISISAFVFRTRAISYVRHLFPVERWIAILCLVFSSVMVMKIIASPYALNGDQLNIIQLFVWFSLVIGSVVLLYPEWIRRYSNGAVAWSVICLACVVGIPPYLVLFREEAKSIQKLRPYEHSLSWIRENVSESDRICSTSFEASVIAAFSGRIAFFTEQNVYDDTSDAELHKNIRALSTIVPATESVASSWRGYFWTRSMSCNAFGPWRRVLSLRLSEEQVDAFLGCQKERIQKDFDVIDQALSVRDASPEEIASLCQWIAVPVESASSWNIPSTATVEYSDDILRLYKTR